MCSQKTCSYHQMFVKPMIYVKVVQKITMTCSIGKPKRHFFFSISTLDSTLQHIAILTPLQKGRFNFANVFCITILSKSIKFLKTIEINSASFKIINLVQLHLIYRRSEKYYINHIIHSLSFADISIFPPEMSNFAKSGNRQTTFWYIFLVLLTFIESIWLV